MHTVLLSNDIYAIVHNDRQVLLGKMNWKSFEDYYLNHTGTYNQCLDRWAIEENQRYLGLIFSPLLVR